MNKYLVLYDYQSGGVGFYVLADSVEQVTERFAPPYNQVIEKDIENHPLVKFMGDKIPCYKMAQFPNCMHGLLIAAARQARGDALPTMPMRWNHLR